MTAYSKPDIVHSRTAVGKLWSGRRPTDDCTVRRSPAPPPLNPPPWAHPSNELAAAAPRLGRRHATKAYAVMPVSVARGARGRVGSRRLRTRAEPVSLTVGGAGPRRPHRAYFGACWDSSVRALSSRIPGYTIHEIRRGLGRAAHAHHGHRDPPRGQFPCAGPRHGPPRVAPRPQPRTVGWTRPPTPRAGHSRWPCAGGSVRRCNGCCATADDDGCGRQILACGPADSPAGHRHPWSCSDVACCHPPSPPRRAPRRRAPPLCTTSEALTSTTVRLCGADNVLVGVL